MWYALYTPGGNEEKIVQVLEEQVEDFKYLIYKRRLRERKEGKWHMVDRKMFPGYVLLDGVMTDDVWQKLRSANAKFRILRNEKDCLVLTEEEVKTLSLLDKDNDGIINMSTGYMDGDHIVVTSGALMGQEARIVSVNKRKGRAKVRVNFCGSERIIELGVELIEKQ